MNKENKLDSTLRELLIEAIDDIQWDVNNITPKDHMDECYIEFISKNIDLLKSNIVNHNDQGLRQHALNITIAYRVVKDNKLDIHEAKTVRHINTIAKTIN